MANDTMPARKVRVKSTDGVTVGRRVSRINNGDGERDAFPSVTAYIVGHPDRIHYYGATLTPATWMRPESTVPA